MSVAPDATALRKLRQRNRILQRDIVRRAAETKKYRDAMEAVMELATQQLSELEALRNERAAVVALAKEWASTVPTRCIGLAILQALNESPGTGKEPAGAGKER